MTDETRPVDARTPGGTADVAQRFAVTTRQIDYWFRVGYLTDDGSPPDSPGSGHTRHLTDDEVARLDLLCRLVAAGVRPYTAAIYARVMVAVGQRTLNVPGGTTITVGGAP